MQCHRVRPQLSALLDHELSPQIAATVRAHLAGCAECRRTYAAYHRDMYALRQFVDTAPWLPVAGAVRVRLADRTSLHPWRRVVGSAIRLVAVAVFVMLAIAIASVASNTIRTAYRGRGNTLTTPDDFSGQSYIYRVTVDHAIRIFDLRAMRVVADASLPVSANVLSIFSPDDIRLYVAYEGTQSGSVRGHVDVFEVATGRRIASVGGLDLMGEGGSTPLLAPSRDGRTVYIHTRTVVSQPGQTGHDACAVATFDVSMNQLLPDTIPLPDCRMVPFVLSGDGKTLYSGAARIDLATQPATIRDNPDLVNDAVVQSPDGRWFYALDETGSVAIWDANAGTVARRYENIVPSYGSYVYQLNGLALSRDGKRLFIATVDAAGGYFGGIVVVDVATGRQIGSLTLVRKALFTSFAADMDGATVSFTTYDDVNTLPANTLTVWEVGKDATHSLALGRIATPTPAPILPH